MAARLILVQGPSGQGKSRSWLNMPHGETFVITPNGKAFPFRGSKAKYKPFDPATGQGNVILTNELNSIPEALNLVNGAKHIKYVLLDDFSHFFSARVLGAGFIADTGFAKWNKFGSDIQAAIFNLAKELRDDLTIVINHHTDPGDDGIYRFRTSGKLLDKVIDPVSHFTYVLHTSVVSGDGGKMEYKFITNFDCAHQAKTPEGCFPDLFIDNDMKYVIEMIEAYENDEEPPVVETTPIT